jgi:hypothetical protein
MTAISKVTSCSVSECCFNDSALCHAAAIQVGRDHPMCDTFTPQTGAACGAPDLTGDVGACLVDSCWFNAQLLCAAPGIIVGGHAGHADCQTYQRR